MNNKPRKKRPFEEAWEIEAEGDVQSLCPIIKRVANELQIENYKVEARPANSKATNTFAWLDVFSTNRTTAHKRPIGVLTLESLGSNRTIVRVPPSSQWSNGDLTPNEVIEMGVIESNPRTLRFCDEHFTQFIGCLNTTLKHYGLKVTWYKRLWRGFKGLVGIAKVVKP